MPAFKQPGRLPPDARIYPHQAFALIEEFRRWIGHATLAEKRARHHTNLETRQGIAMALLREKHPMFDAFDLYDKATFGQRRVPNRLSDELVDLAAVAAQFSVVGPTLDDENTRHHRHSLLGAGLRSTLLEWKAASSLAQTNNAKIAWLSPSDTGPEFIAIVGEHELEVECKHVSHMITELFGDTEAGALADGFFAAIRGLGLCGEATIELSAEFSALAASERIATLGRALSNASAGELVVDDPGNFKLTARLAPAGSAGVNAAQWHRELIRRKESDARAYGNALARPPLAVDPIVLFMTGPRRTSEALRDHIWEFKFKKGAEQCSTKRGAVLVVEWEGIEDATTFVESEGMQALLHRTFDEYRHIAGIVMRCDNAPMRIGGTLDLSTHAYLARSNVTNFPAVAELLQFAGSRPQFEANASGGRIAIDREWPSVACTDPLGMRSILGHCRTTLPIQGCGKIKMDPGLRRDDGLS